MSKDIKELLDGALPPAPPAAMDSDGAVEAGRKALGRRRTLAGGGALAGVAAVAVAISLAMNMVGGGSVPGGNAAADPSASSSEGSTRYETNGLPAVYSDKFYMWATTDELGLPSTASQNATTQAYFDEFSKYVNDTYGGYDVGMTEGFSRYDSRLIQWDAYPKNEIEDPYKIILTQPRYELSFGIHPHDGTGPLVKEVGGSGELVKVDVWAPGDFTDGTNGDQSVYSPINGTANMYDLIGCDDFVPPAQFEQNIEVKVDCKTATSAEGERVVHSTVRITSSEGDSVTRTTVLYREDGSAVVVRDDDAEGTGDTSFDGDALLGFASALPDAPVQ